MASGTAVPSPTFGPQGFQAPPAPAILAGVQADISAAFGAALNFNLNTPQGQLASSEAAVINNAYGVFCWQANQFDPAYAVGRNQDALCRIYFIERNPSEPTTLQVSCTGAGAFIPDSTNAERPARDDRPTSAGNLYTCLTAGRSPAAAAGASRSRSRARSRGRSPSRSPSRSTRPSRGGTRSPSSPASRASTRRAGRRSSSAARIRSRGTASARSARSSAPWRTVPGVIDYYGNANPTAAPVTIGGVTIPAYSTYICVAGGAPTAVGQAILSKKSPGSPLTGNTVVTVFDSNPLYASPIPYTITYQIPAPLQVLFKVVIASGPLVPTNAAALVQAALLAAFAGNSLTASFTGSIAGTTLTVSALSAGRSWSARSSRTSRTSSRGTRSSSGSGPGRAGSGRTRSARRRRSPRRR